MDTASEMISVIVDTNTVRSERSFEYLLGSRPALQKLGDRIKLVIPEMVIEELITQKRIHFNSSKQTLQGSSLLKLLDLVGSTISSLSFDKYEHRLRDDQSIPYTIARTPQDANAFATITEMALHNTPPFNKGNDKGFKDACVVLAAAEYINQHANETIYVVSNDDRVIAYFSDNKRCTCIRRLDDLIGLLTDNPLTASPAEEGPSEAADDYPAIQPLIDGLRSSGSFSRTHRIIANLAANKEKLGLKEKLELFEIAVRNTQVNQIMRDTDLMDFFVPLFRECEPLLDESVYSSFVKFSDISDIRAERRGDPTFCDSEITAYQSFANELCGLISAVDRAASIDTDCDRLLPELRQQLLFQKLEGRVSSSSIVSTLIYGAYTLRPNSHIQAKTIQEFVDVLANATPEKRTVLCTSLQNRLEELPQLPEPFPF